MKPVLLVGLLLVVVGVLADRAIGDHAAGFDVDAVGDASSATQRDLRPDHAIAADDNADVNPATVGVAQGDALLEVDAVYAAAHIAVGARQIVAIIDSEDLLDRRIDGGHLAVRGGERGDIGEIELALGVVGAQAGERVE